MIEAGERSGGGSSAGPWTCDEWGSCELELDDSPGSNVRALVLYLRGTGAAGTGARDMTLVVVGGKLCLVAGGGEEGRTRGLKLYPPRVLAIPR